MVVGEEIMRVIIFSLFVFYCFCVFLFFPVSLFFCFFVTKGSVSYLSSPCFSTIIGGIGGPGRGKRRILDVMY